MRKRDDVDRGSGIGEWGRLALLCAFLGCLNPRPEELPSNGDNQFSPVRESADEMAVPTAAGATGPAEVAPNLAPEALPEDAEPGPDQSRIALPPPVDAGTDAGADAGTD